MDMWMSRCNACATSLLWRFSPALLHDTNYFPLDLNFLVICMCVLSLGGEKIGMQKRLVLRDKANDKKCAWFSLACLIKFNWLRL